MGKLGFAINRASQGAGRVFTCNEGKWTNRVVDVREYLKLFNGLDGSDNILPFLSFDEDGCFVTMLKAISGRNNDFVAGWIYVPRTISITGSQIIDKMKNVKEILSQPNIGALKDSIASVFAEEYKERASSSYIPSTGDRYGIRKVDAFHSLEEILDNRYQDEYQGFKAIFLVDSVSVSKEYTSKFGDFTKHKLEKFNILVNPKDVKAQFGADVNLYYIENKQYKQFNVPIRIKQDAILNMALWRNGFEPFIFEYHPVKQDNETCDLTKIQPKWQYKISHSSIKVYGEDKQVIDDVQIYIHINNKKSQLFEDALLNEDECRNAKIEINANGYEDFEKPVNLFQNSNGMEIQLKKKKRKSSFGIELESGEIGNIIIEGRTVSSHECPLKGYSKNEDGVLRLSDRYKWKQRIIGFALAIVAFCLIIGCVYISNWIDNNNFKWQFGIPPLVVTPIQHYGGEYEGGIDEGSGVYETDKQISQDAITYLDTYSSWRKDSIDLYSELQGLFDDLNNFELEKICGEDENSWANKLSSSTQFQKIVSAAIECKTNNWNPKQENHTPTYNTTPGDIVISVKNYVDWLSKDQSTSAITEQNSQNNNGGNNNNTSTSGKNTTSGKKLNTGKNNNNTESSTLQTGNQGI